MRKHYILFILLIGIHSSGKSQVLLNEVSNANKTHLISNDGENYDWIELYNSSSTDIVLSGYALSDNADKLDKWVFGDIIIKSKAYLLIYASGKNTGLHTNFRISGEGETIYLSRDITTFGITTKAIIDSIFCENLENDHSLGRCNDGGNEWGVFAQATPGGSNSESNCYEGYEPEPEFSITSGFYSGSQILSIANPSGSGEIRYTVNGAFPTPNDPICSGPVSIDKSMVVIARIYSKENKLPGKTVKNTYLIDEDNFDLPVFSLSLDPDDLWDDDTGIYTNYELESEKYCNVEYFDKQKNKQFDINAGVSLMGNYSRAKPQKSFRIYTRGTEYGTGWLNYPLLEERPELQKYKRFNLRNGGSDYNYTRFRDAFMQRVLKDSPVDRMAYEPAIVFLNGEYWGEYEIREQENPSYILSHHGVPKEEIDFLYHKGSKVRAKLGSVDAFDKAYDAITKGDTKNEAFYDMAYEHLDLKNFTDYLIAGIYYFNRDWIDHTAPANNIRLWRHRIPGGKIRYMYWDLDMGSGLYGGNKFPPDSNTLSMVLNPDEDNVHSDMFRTMTGNTQFRNYFVNRYADLMNTVFQMDNIKSIVYEMRDKIDQVMPRHRERWDMKSYESWLDDVEYVIDWHSRRMPYARKHVEKEFDLEKQVNITLDVKPEGAGKIQISTIIPENLPWSGIYYDGVPVTIYAIPNHGYTFDRWDTAMDLYGKNGDHSITVNLSSDDKFTAHFSGTPVEPKITVSEINYHPHAEFNSGAWIELHNYGNAAVDISGWSLFNQYDVKGFVFPAGTVLQPDEHIVAVENSARFALIHPHVDNYIGDFKFCLLTGGDQIRLLDHHKKTVTAFTYSNSFPWPSSAAGEGYTLELSTAGDDLNNASSWFAGCLGGSPGKEHSPCYHPVIFSEVNYKSSKDLNTGDWVELLNTTNEPVDITGWVFKDDKNYNSFVIPSETVLPPGGYLVLCQDPDKFQALHSDVVNYTGPFNFGLSRDNETLRIFDSQGVLVMQLDYQNIYPWPTEADGSGATLEMIDVNGKQTHPSNWYAECYGGTPGLAPESCKFRMLTNNGNIQNDLSITIAPNPSAGLFTVTVNAHRFNRNLHYQIYDMNGKQVKQKKAIGDNAFNIDLGKVSPGVYFIRFMDDDGLVTERKLVVGK